MGETSQTLPADTQLFRNVFDASPIGIAVENLEGQPLFVNPAFCSMLGFSEEEMCTKHCVQFSPPEDAEEDWALFQQLRAGSIDHYQLEKRYFRRDGSLVWGRLTISLLKHCPSPLVIAMVEEITAEKAAEEALLEVNRALKEQAALLQSREELLKIFVKSVPVGVAMLDRDMCYLQVSDRWCADYSMDSSYTLGRSHYELFPDIPERWKEVHRRALAGETLRADEDPWAREGGATTWVRWEILPWRTASGVVGGILIFAEDITHRKDMEEAISGMSRKLIESQEQERARIGRELHDDISQRLAMLSVELERLQDSPSEVRSRVQELRARTTEISDDVQALSHELHASKLEYLGAVAGMRSWCREFGERQGIQIEFKGPEGKISLPPEIGLCLFRVLQEALHNAAKYSGVRRIEVQLREDWNEIHLLVSDLGRGFDLETVRQGRGLGLTSMQERVRLVNGTIEIQATPRGGTTVHVRVPLMSGPVTQRAAG
jgi:PAS domain S-box-containing protein